MPAAPLVFRCDIDVAARGWDHDAWCGDFFPLDLPRQWRLAFYANHFRSVLVPGRVLLPAESADLGDWHRDTHEEFRFFLEISVRLVERFRHGGSAALLRWLEPLRGRIAGLLLLGFSRRCEPTFGRWLKVLAERFAIYTLAEPARVQAAAGTAISVLQRLQQCWQPGLDAAASGRSGRFGLLLSPAGDLAGLRRQLEAFMIDTRQTGRATLCFAGCPPPLDRMQQARILVELLGA